MAAFSTVDLKLPPDGPAKILELNGLTSGLTGYGEERRALSIVERANSVIDTLGVPVGRFLWNPQRQGYEEIFRDTHPFDARRIEYRLARHEEAGWGVLHQALHGNLNGTESSLAAEYLAQHRDGGTPVSGDAPPLASIEESAVIVEVVDTDAAGWQGADPPDGLVVNPREIRLLGKDKVLFDRFARHIQAARYRPRSSLLTTVMPNLRRLHDLREAEDVERVVLKYPEQDNGTGVTVLTRQELTVLTDIAARIGSWDAMLEQLAGRGFQTRFEAQFFRQGGASQLLVEEYIPSKVVKGPDGTRYDATMRVVISTLANRGKVTVVPLGGYWKLPESGRWPDVEQVYSDRSNVHHAGSLPVSEDDFRRAFRDVADFMKRTVHHARSRNPAVNFWSRQGYNRIDAP